jgi:hypothetical protein
VINHNETVDHTLGNESSNPLELLDCSDENKNGFASRQRGMGDCLLQSLLVLPSDHQQGRIAYLAGASIFVVIAAMVCGRVCLFAWGIRHASD